MAIYDYSYLDRAEAYKTLAEFFLKAPDEDTLIAIRDEFELESQDSAEEIRKEFERLFNYPEGKLPPIESFFLTLENTSSSEEVARFYADAGLTYGEEFEFIPDHLYLELIFMSYLIEANRYDLQEKFLEEHVMNWVPLYCDELQKEAKTAFYREIAILTRDFLIAESEEEFT